MARRSSCVAGPSVAAAFLPISKPHALRGGLWRRRFCQSGRRVARREAVAALRGGLWRRRRFCQSASRARCGAECGSGGGRGREEVVAVRAVCGGGGFANQQAAVALRGGLWRRRRFCQVAALRGGLWWGRLLSTAQAYCPAAGNRESVAGGPTGAVVSQRRDWAVDRRTSALVTRRARAERAPRSSCAAGAVCGGGAAAVDRTSVLSGCWQP